MLNQQTSLNDILPVKNETIRTNFERKSIETHNRCSTITSDSLVFKTKNLELVIYLFYAQIKKILKDILK